MAALAVIAVAAAAFTVRGPNNRAVASPTSSPRGNGGPLRVVSLTPVANSTGVPSNTTISVRFSASLGSHSPSPSLNPPVPGTWQVVTPDTYMFVPTAPLVPSSTETVSVPAGDGGVVSASGQPLTEGASARFTVAQGSTLRLQQLLAQLGYLPVSFTPAGPLAAPQEAAEAQQGSFNWRGSEPTSLQSLWNVGTPNEITTGAVMAFESQHNMKTDGSAGPALWTQLLTDAAAGVLDPGPYNYVYVDKSLPQTVTVYSNGAPVYSTRANTGVAAAPTASGTFPVYVRYRVTTMSGTNPDGSKYSDPGIPWVSYFNGGDALHGFVRGGYGYPQSDGCVEMPPANAAVVYPLTPIGTLVTVA
ncbi:MAG TPA: L,D-transpeptidase family protein [Acidimicrobiales bacterium]|nr:L,D-transpeptidase family protein [Acidimicrobiales bacterium]